MASADITRVMSGQHDILASIPNDYVADLPTIRKKRGTVIGLYHMIICWRPGAKSGNMLISVQIVNIVTGHHYATVQYMSQRAFPYFLFVITAYSLISRIVGYFMPIYFQELGLSGIQTGFYVSLSAVATLILSVPMGISTDRKNLTSIFMFSFLLIGLSYVGFLISRSFVVFCLFALVGSFGHRFYGLAQNTMFFKLSSSDNRQQTGIFTLMTMIAMGIGMIAGGQLIAASSFRTVFTLMFVGHLVFIAFAYFLPRTETVSIAFADYRRSVFTPQVLFLTAIFMLSSSHWGAESLSYGPFLKDVLGLSFRQIGVFTGLGLMMVGLGAYAGTWLLRKGWIADLQTLFIWGLMLAGTFHVLMCVPNVYLSFVFRLFHEVGDGFVLVIFYHGVARVFHVDRIGGCAAFITLGQSLSSFFSGMLFGYISQTWGHQASLMLSGVILLLAAGLLHARRHALFQSDPLAAPVCSASHP